MSVFQEEDSFMGLEFQIQGDKVCYIPLKDKCDTIRNLESPKTLRQMSFLWNSKLSFLIFTQFLEIIDTNL